jgi:hypothetical protein
MYFKMHPKIIKNKKLLIINLRAVCPQETTSHVVIALVCFLMLSLIQYWADGYVSLAMFLLMMMSVFADSEMVSVIRLEGSKMTAEGKNSIRKL